MYGHLTIMRSDPVISSSNKQTIVDHVTKNISIHLLLVQLSSFVYWFKFYCQASFDAKPHKTNTNNSNNKLKMSHWLKPISLFFSNRTCARCSPTSEGTLVTRNHDRTRGTYSNANRKSTTYQLCYPHYYMGHVWYCTCY